MKMKSSKHLSAYAAVPKDPAKTQERALKRQLQPKDPHKMSQKRKLPGSV